MNQDVKNWFVDNIAPEVRKIARDEIQKSSGSSPTKSHLIIDGRNGDAPYLYSEYTFTADSVEKSSEGDATLDDSDVITENSNGTYTVNGWTRGGVDAYDVVNPTIKSVKGYSDVYLDGNKVAVDNEDAMRREEYLINEGTEFETTVYDIKGADPYKSGKTVFMIGGQHGDEPEGYLTAEEYITSEFDRGRMVIIPRANPPAINDGTRQYDNIDFNRTWGSSSNFTPSKNIWALIREVDPDIFFDLHSARGLYRESVRGIDAPGDSVGQAIFPCPAGVSPLNFDINLNYMASFDSRYSPSNKTLVDVAINEVNKDISETVGDEKMYFIRGNTQNDSSSSLASHRWGSTFPDRPGFLVETTRWNVKESNGVNWQIIIIDSILSLLGFTLGAK